MRRLLLVVLVAVLGSLTTQSRAQTWARGYVGDASEAFLDVVVTLGQDTVFAGYTTSFGQGGRDVWVVKVSDCGFVEWQRTFGGQGDEQAAAIIGQGDGGYIVAATTNSFGAGGSDFWVLRLDADGNLVNERVYGGALDEQAVDIIERPDGFALLGNVLSQQDPGNVALVKLKPGLEHEWTRIYGGFGDDRAAALDYALGSANLIIAGSTNSFGAGDGDIWLLELTPDGDPFRERVYHGLGPDMAHDIKPFVDIGGARYLVAGETTDPTDGKEMWLLAIQSDLTVAWSRVFGGPGTQVAHAVLPSLTSGGLVLVGENDGAGAGGTDAWLLQLDPFGNITTQQTYGTSADERTLAVQENIFTGEYVIAGTQNSDAWALRLDVEMEIGGTCPLDADTGEPDTPLTATILYPQSFNVNDFPAETVSSVFAVDSTASVHLACTGRPSEVSGPDLLRGSRRFLEPLIFTGEDDATWEPATRNCADTFNIYVGDLLDLANLKFGTCLVNQVQQNAFQLSQNPLPGRGLFYLVTGVNQTGEGTLGFTTVQVERFPEGPCP